MKSEDFLNRLVHNYIGGGAGVSGKKFGIELELEGRNVGLHDIATRGWNRHAEPSLRGESIEFTTAGAKSLEDTQKIVNDLFDKFAKHGAKINNSLRASTHVHLNFADQPMKKVINFYALFTLLEELLQYYCGEERKGSHFCLSTREGEGIVGVLAGCVRMGDFSAFAGDRYKYAACNLSSIYKFGTVEVRSMRGARTGKEVNAWVDILSDMYDYAVNKMVSPAKLVQDLSAYGAEELINQIFQPKNVKELLSTFPVIHTLHHSFMEGARILQVFAYEFDEAFLAEPLKQEVMKAEKALIKGKLPEWQLHADGHIPVIIPFGPHRGVNYQIYLPNGEPWNCFPRNGKVIWEDGDQLDDCRECYWDAIQQRFVYERREDGAEFICNWIMHHDIAQEPRPHPVELHVEPEDEPEPEWDNEDNDGDFNNDF